MKRCSVRESLLDRGNSLGQSAVPCIAPRHMVSSWPKYEQIDNLDSEIYVVSAYPSTMNAAVYTAVQSPCRFSDLSLLRERYY
jgi:hypothetical protein